MPLQWVLASDIDGTLTGDPQALARLKNRLDSLRKEGKLFLILSTGRRLQQVLDGFEREGIPRADAIISQVGTEIYLPPFTPDTAPLSAWDRLLRRRFSRRRALLFLKGIEGLVIQPPENNTPLKVSCYLNRSPDPEMAAAEVRRRVAHSGESGIYQVVWSSGRDLDIIPAAAGKGKSIRFLIDNLQLSPRQVIVAGDSGNDRSMFEAFSYGIIVANAQPELKRLQAEARPHLYFARGSFAAGVEEGLRNWGVWGDSSA